MSVGIMFGIKVDGNGPEYEKGTNFLKKLGYEKDFEEQVVNGCDHSFDRKTMKFCPECGSPAIKVEPALEYAELVGEIPDEVSEKTGLDFCWMDDLGWVLGVQISGETFNTACKKITKAIPILKKYFPKETPTFLC